MATAHQAGGVYKNADGKGYHDADGQPINKKEAERLINDRERARLDEIGERDAAIEEREALELAARKAARERVKGKTDGEGDEPGKDAGKGNTGAGTAGSGNAAKGPPSAPDGAPGTPAKP